MLREVQFAQAPVGISREEFSVRSGNRKLDNCWFAFRAHRLTSLWPVVDKDRNYSQQHKEQKNHQSNETITRHPLFVSHGPKSGDAAGSQIAHELRIGGGRGAKLIPRAAKQGG